MKFLIFLSSFFLGVMSPCVRAEGTPAKNAGVIPAKLNMAASAYTIHGKSLSPDGKYGVASPKEVGDDLSLARNFIVAVKPFEILTVLDGDGMNPESKRLSLDVKWTADSSQVLATTRHSKWDLIVGSSLVVLSKGKVAQRVDLLSGINGQLLADFKKSKAEVYNEILPFILVNSQIKFVDEGKGVSVTAEALNDPNEARNIQWTQNFKGQWHVAEAKWESPAAEEADVMSEKFGELALGQASADVVKIMGEPESKGKNTRMDATGEWQQEWAYPAQGLKLHMGATEEKGAKTLAIIIASGACKLATARGIKIGSSEADVGKAYAKERDKEQSQAGQGFIAGSIYGGVMFDFKKGRVAQIFIGAGAE